MASKIDRITHKIEAYQNEMANRLAATDQLQAEIDELDNQRDQAIDQDDLDTVERLTRQRADLLIKLDARKAVDARKAQKGITADEIIDAWNDDCTDYQKRVTAAEKELINALVIAANKTKALADIGAEGYRARESAIKLLGSDNKDDSFNYPKFKAALFSLDYLKKDFIMQSCPGVREYIFSDQAVQMIRWLNS